MGMKLFLREILIQVGMSIVLLSGASCSSSSDSTPPPPPPNTINCVPDSVDTVEISGRATFDLITFNANNIGLDYISPAVESPIRGAIVELVGARVLSITNTDSAGNYCLSAPSGSSNLFVRVKAQMKQTGTPSWNFTVVDNTQSQALYAMDSSLFDATANMTINLHADSGWGNTSYTSTRVAGPFAILDSVYQAYTKVLEVDSTAAFPALKLNWSVNNINIYGDIALGQIGTSYFDRTAIYLLGSEDSDTDEYDDHVVIHEWGHYFEEFFSRADSIGGPHGGGDILDPRVAFGEGWGNALSGMVTDDPVYSDSFFTQQSGGFFIDVDANTCTNPGWFSECSVQAILYDLYDSVTDGADDVDLGFGPIYSVLTNEQKNTSATTTIFSFIKPLKDNTGVAGSIDTLVADQTIVNIADVYGSAETNNPGTTNQLPVYTQATQGGGTVNVCSTSQHAAYNGLGVHRFVRFTPSTGSITITASKTSGPASTDPDMELFKNGVSVGLAENTTLNSETMVVTVTNNEHVLVVYNWNYYVTATSGEACFNITVN